MAIFDIGPLKTPPYWVGLILMLLNGAGLVMVWTLSPSSDDRIGFLKDVEVERRRRNLQPIGQGADTFQDLVETQEQLYPKASLSGNDL
jgi:hypothetical protein